MQLSQTSQIDPEEADLRQAAEFEACRERLLRVVRIRIDSRLTGRLDPDDVLQEAYVDAWKRRGEFDPAKGTLLVWLRFIALQKLTELHRKHLKVKSRDARREVAVGFHGDGGASSVVLASALLGRLTGPVSGVSRAELCEQVQIRIERLPEADQELLIMRHFEQLSNSEVAETLGISVTAACNRHVRALERLRELLSDVRGIEDVLNA